MFETGRWRDAGWNSTLLTYTFANGSYIEFFSADMESKLRGARRQILYINEANNVSFEAYYQLAIRTSELIWLDFNPTMEFWAHTEVLTEPDSELIILNYLDNEALPDTIKRDIEQAREKAKTSEYWANWWKVYGLGEIGSLQGAIFENWQQCDLIPDGAEYLGTGLDFGFTNDPTAATDLYRHDGLLYLDEVLYDHGLTNADIWNRLKDKPRKIIADSAEPKSIEELRRMGASIEPAQKGKDSVNFGIQVLQRYDMRVTKKSVNLIKELRGYIWAKDKEGNTGKDPIDNFNHAIDGIRYVAMKKLSQNNVGKYLIR